MEVAGKSINMAYIRLGLVRVPLIKEDRGIEALTLFKQIKLILCENTLLNSC